MNSITITLRLPTKWMSPNSKPFTSRQMFMQREANRVAKKLAWAVTREAIGSNEPPMWENATFQPVFYWKTNARHDKDNANASLKAYQDGIAIAGVVTDDYVIEPLPAIFKKDALNPRVEITITEVE